MMKKLLDKLTQLNEGASIEDRIADAKAKAKAKGRKVNDEPVADKETNRRYVKGNGNYGTGKDNSAEDEDQLNEVSGPKFKQKSSSEPALVTCKHCNGTTALNSKFCWRCGKPVDFRKDASDLYKKQLSTNQMEDDSGTASGKITEASKSGVDWKTADVVDLGQFNDEYSGIVVADSPSGVMVLGASIPGYWYADNDGEDYESDISFEINATTDEAIYYPDDQYGSNLYLGDYASEFIDEVVNFVNSLGTSFAEIKDKAKGANNPFDKSSDAATPRSNRPHNNPGKSYTGKSKPVTESKQLTESKLELSINGQNYTVQVSAIRDGDEYDDPCYLQANSIYDQAGNKVPYEGNEGLWDEVALELENHSDMATDMALDQDISYGDWLHDAYKDGTFESAGAMQESRKSKPITESVLTIARLAGVLNEGAIKNQLTALMGELEASGKAEQIRSFIADGNAERAMIVIRRAVNHDDQFAGLGHSLKEQLVDAAYEDFDLETGGYNASGQVRPNGAYDAGGHYDLEKGLAAMDYAQDDFAMDESVGADPYFEQMSDGELVDAASQAGYTDIAIYDWDGSVSNRAELIELLKSAEADFHVDEGPVAPTGQMVLGGAADGDDFPPAPEEKQYVLEGGANLDSIIAQHQAAVDAFIQEYNETGDAEMDYDLEADLHHYYYDSLSFQAQTDADDDGEIRSLFIADLEDRGMLDNGMDTSVPADGGPGEWPAPKLTRNQDPEWEPESYGDYKHNLEEENLDEWAENKDFDALWNEHVPMSGEAQSEIGEAVRALGRLEYDYYNNGYMNARDQVESDDYYDGNDDEDDTHDYGYDYYEDGGFTSYYAELFGKLKAFVSQNSTDPSIQAAVNALDTPAWDGRPDALFQTAVAKLKNWFVTFAQQQQPVLESIPTNHIRAHAEPIARAANKRSDFEHLNPHPRSLHPDSEYSRWNKEFHRAYNSIHGHEETINEFDDAQDIFGPASQHPARQHPEFAAWEKKMGQRGGITRNHSHDALQSMVGNRSIGRFHKDHGEQMHEEQIAETAIDSVMYKGIKLVLQQLIGGVHAIYKSTDLENPVFSNANDNVVRQKWNQIKQLAGQAQPVTENVNMQITADGEDVVDVIRKLSGISASSAAPVAPMGEPTPFGPLQEPAEVDVVAIGGSNDVDQPVDEEYANEPNEENFDLDALLTQGNDMHRCKGAYARTQPGDNPRAVKKIEESLWAKFKAEK